MKSELLAVVVGAFSLAMVSCGPGKQAPLEPSRALPAEPVAVQTPANAAPADAGAPEPASPPVLAVPEQPSPTESQYAIVPQSTRLYAEASADSEWLPFDLVRPPRGGDAIARPTVVRVIASHGEWTEIETVPIELGAARFHCYDGGGHPGLHSLALRVFVRTEALAQVTTATTEVALGKKTAVTVQPGLRVAPATRRKRDGRYRVGRSRVRKVKLPDDAVGNVYTPVANFAPGVANRGLRQGAPKRLMRLGDGTQFKLYQGSDFDAATETRKGWTGSKHSGCVKYDFFIPKKWMQVLEPGSPHALLAPKTEDAPGGPHPVAGAPAYWQSGGKAGYVRAEQPFREDAGEAGGRRCLRKSLQPVRTDGDDQPAQHPEQDFVLCFDPAHVVGDEIPPAPRPQLVTIAELPTEDSDVFLVDGTVAWISSCGPCPPRRKCAPCRSPYIRFEDDSGVTEVELSGRKPPRTPRPPHGAVAVGKRVRLLVRHQSGVIRLVRFHSVLN